MNQRRLHVCQICLLMWCVFRPCLLFMNLPADRVSHVWYSQKPQSVGLIHLIATRCVFSHTSDWGALCVFQCTISHGCFIISHGSIAWHCWYGHEHSFWLGNKIDEIISLMDRIIQIIVTYNTTIILQGSKVEQHESHRIVEWLTRKNRCFPRK